ncbi:pyridoxal-phosphate dependent enzyme [Verrucosispora sioxanthis]|uniref:pyridoxal-phosphate dependent enzyme n=1 Tax=Verrucosispora sioxanthis TaxID=2499994 RepID=UPI0028151D9C|nr:pyridoxal-phosphate dependent enzyme [Verrucosispora sioxanthis]
MYGVEPRGCDSLARSLAAGRPVAVTPAPTIADGLRPSCVGELPFAVLRDRLRAVVRVDDDEIAAAFRLLLLELKVLAEPSGAAGLAGALRLATDATLRSLGSGGTRRLTAAERLPAAAGARPPTIGVVLTGGNVEPELVARLTATARIEEEVAVA